MSENKPDNAGPSGTPDASIPRGAANPASKPEAMPATSTPPAAKEAASTDSPESASNVTPDGASGAAPARRTPAGDVSRERAQSGELYQGHAAATAATPASAARPEPMRGQQSAYAAQERRPAVSPSVSASVSPSMNPAASAPLAAS